MGKPKEKIIKDNAERWLLTYADLMNLLLIFFIILYAISQTDQQKFEQLAASLHAAFGQNSSSSLIDGGGGSPSLINLNGNNPSPVIKPSLEEQKMDKVKEKVTELIEKNSLNGDVNVSIQERGVVISITAQLLFKSGSSELESNSKPTIQEIGKILLAIPGNQIRVEGHTDNDPIRSSTFASNWELSSARATNVLRLLVDKVHIDPTTISAVGYGEYRPKVPNNSPANKAANRRVDIVIVKSKFDSVEAGMTEPQSETQDQESSNTEEIHTDESSESH